MLVVASFFIKGLCFELLVFWGCLIFHQRSLFCAPCVFGLPLLSTEVFVLSPLRFGVAYFFHWRSLF
jgi:hypothetical protein